MFWELVGTNVLHIMRSMQYVFMLQGFETQWYHASRASRSFFKQKNKQNCMYKICSLSFFIHLKHRQTIFKSHPQLFTPQQTLPRKQRHFLRPTATSELFPGEALGIVLGMGRCCLFFGGGGRSFIEVVGVGDSSIKNIDVIENH